MIDKKEKNVKHQIETMEEHIAYEVKYYRKQRGMTQSDLAKAAKVSLLTIYQLETCKRIISITTLIKVAHALNKRIEIKFVRDLTGSWSCQ